MNAALASSSSGIFSCLVKPKLALAQAAAASDPAARKPLLAGAPVAVKCNFAMQGAPVSAASSMLANWTAPYDSTVVSRLREAGGTLIGLTNADEFAMGSASTFSVHGPVPNPVSPPQGPVMTAGGSSGGSAAAVAAGIVHAAIGSDTGGSVRQPAAFTGTVGLKPTYGRIPRWGLIAFASSLDTPGIFARTVGDAALVLDTLAGADGKDDTAVPAPRRPVSLAALQAMDACDGTGYIVPPWKWEDSGLYTGGCAAWHPTLGSKRAVTPGLRVGVPEQAWLAELPEPVVAAWEASLHALQDAGATIERVSLPSMRAALPVYSVLTTAEAASNLARYDGVRYGAGAEREATQQLTGDAGSALAAAITAVRSKHFGPEVQRRILLGNFVLSGAARSAWYNAALTVRARMSADIHAVFASGVHMLCMPTAPGQAWPLADTAGMSPLALYMNDLLTIPANLAGLPALAVPVGTSPTPVAHPTQGTVMWDAPQSVQLMGRAGGEAPLCWAAAAMAARLASPNLPESS